MSYQTSHGVVGGGPFRPNKSRGGWANPHDFALACLNNAFRSDNIYGVVIVSLILSNGFWYILLWLVSAILCAIPIFFLQSFLGQFSSSGYISAFRIAPLFKGLGYIGLGLNLISLAFHGTLIAIPMLYLIHSLQPTLPWSCEAHHPWREDSSDESSTNFSTFSLFTSHCDLDNSKVTNETFVILSIPSVEFFRYKMEAFNFDVFGCVLVVWVAVSFAAHQTTEKIGTFMRYCTIVAVTLLVIVFLRLIALPEVWSHIGTPKTFVPNNSWVFCMLLAAITAFMMTGPGWGSILNLASYNKLKTDIRKPSWVIPLCQLAVLTMLALVAEICEINLTRNKKQQIVIPHSTDLQWMNIMTIPSTLASISFPHLWTWIFLIMIIIGSFNLMLIQMFSVHTALLDEFEQLRPFRKQLIFGSAAALGLISAFFCTLDGVYIIEDVVDLNILSQCYLNLILVIVVLWVYGRDRFVRDVKFMTNELLPNWNIHYVRFVAPLFIMLMAFIVTVVGTHYQPNVPEYTLLCAFLTILPWFALPAYFVYRLRQASGDWKLRLSRCIKPTDWFPVDPEEKQRYDEVFENHDATHNLTIVP